MYRPMTLRLLLTLMALLSFGQPVQARSVNTGHVEAELIAQERGIVPGGTVFVALLQSIKPGWHTYWRNPGDAGEATKLEWTLPAGWTAGDIVWPTPVREPVGPLLDFAYRDVVLLPVPITAPATARPGERITLKAGVSYLVCKETCVPEDTVLTLDLPVFAQAPGLDPKWGDEIADTLAKAPKAAGLKATYQFENGQLALSVAGAPLRGADVQGAFFFPYSGKVIDHPKPQTLDRGPDGLTLHLAPGYEFKAGPPPSDLTGVLALADGAWEVTARPGQRLPGTFGLGAPPATPPSAALTFPVALAFAFLGGLILNLMPCVFPVLSIKAASLVAHAHERGQMRLQGLVFTLGVAATFLALAGLLIALKAAGQQLGWGFQLQSPPVVASLALTLLLVGLNLSGVFEMGTSLQGTGQGLAARPGLSGAFFTGALAVVVAAPCTAPFMAPALGFALTQPPTMALAVFFALAMGLAAPFALLAFVPGLLSRLPRPGAWMEGFKHSLAFPMYGAAAWLIWVLAQQTERIGLALVLAATVVTAFGAWLYGAMQRQLWAGGKGRVWSVAGLLAIIAAFASVALSPYAPPAAASDKDTAQQSAPSDTGRLPSQTWSPERLKALRAAGHPVLVDFTAAWCVTCQVNEKVALNTSATLAAFRRLNAVYLVADWTNRDPQIAQALAEQGRAGVPLYLLYAPGDAPPKVLPQLLTEGMVIEALEAAR